MGGWPALPRLLLWLTTPWVPLDKSEGPWLLSNQFFAKQRVGTRNAGTPSVRLVDCRGRRTSVTDQNGKVTNYAYDDAESIDERD
jgi:YD repeat-containing protein